jgi:hypothetical protein
MLAMGLLYTSPDGYPLGVKKQRPLKKASVRQLILYAV